MHAVSNHRPIIQTSIVQGHPAWRFIVPIESPLMVCCLTSFKSNIVSHHIRDICCENPWPRSWTVYGHPGSKFTVPIDSEPVVSYSTSIDTSLNCDQLRNSFRVTDWLTRTQSDFIICRMLLMHWADKNKKERENVFTVRLHVMQRTVLLSQFWSVRRRPSVCPSVCQTRVLWQN